MWDRIRPATRGLSYSCTEGLLPRDTTTGLPRPDTLGRLLTARPLQNAIRDHAIADSLAGHADAKASWSGYAMNEDISTMTSRVNVPTMLLTGEHDAVDPSLYLRSDSFRISPTRKYISCQG